jgi:membrane-bound ClpP family serine protease
LRVGETAVVATDLSPTGTVHAGGEDWTAVSDSGETIKQGEEVIVSEIQGLTLEVFRASEVERQLEEGNENSEPAS